MVHVLWILTLCLHIFASLHGLPTESVSPKQTDTPRTCPEGHYQSQHDNGQNFCKQCTTCNRTETPCTEFKDTVCCPENISFTEKNSTETPTSPNCRKLSRFCSKGQHVNAFESKCVACLEGEFMPLEIHSMHKCWPCPSVETIPNSKIIQLCNSTHPTLLVCKEGYYVKPSTEEGKGTFGECLPCRNCSHVDRERQSEHDTVCCSQPNMDVVDTKDRPNSLQGKSTTEVVAKDPETSQRPCPTCPKTTSVQEGPFKILFYIFFASSVFMITLLVVNAILKWRRKRRRRKRTNRDSDEHYYSTVHL